MPFWDRKKKPKDGQDEALMASLRAANPELAAEVARGRERSEASGELHAHEVTSDDAAVIRMLAGSTWADGASMTLPSGKTITGSEAQRWIDANPAVTPSREEDSRAPSLHKSTTTPAFRMATLDEYVAWLRLYLQQGGKPTHYQDAPFDRQGWLVAEKSFTTGGECGALSTSIIVPAGIRHLHGDLGHNRLYLMDGPRVFGDIVPLFDDPVFRTLSEDIPDFIAEQEASQAASMKDAERRQAEALQRSRKGDLGRYLHPKR